MIYRLERVHFMPKELEPGVLYHSEEFETAAHLCACGCGQKIRTPIGPTEWSLEEGDQGPSLSPSVGNWHKACKSHYWITNGQVTWSYAWSDKEIENGRQHEQLRRQAHYEAPTYSIPVVLEDVPEPGLWVKIWRWLVGPFKAR
jgi:hypothetical protein